MRIPLSPTAFGARTFSVPFIAGDSNGADRLRVSARSVGRRASLGALSWLLFLGGSPAHAAAPAVNIASAPLIAPGDALAYYGTPSSPAAPSTRDPLVREIARSLHFDIDLIFAHVRDHTRLLPQFGLVKGARGVILDGYGTAFDQAQFMVDSLREADAVAGKGYNAAYVMGQITLSTAQFQAWTGVGDAATATRLLANGGIPATVSGSGTNFSVTMEHVWVQATVGGATYLFDPSYKPQTSGAGINWKSASGYAQATLLNAGAAGNTTSVSGFNAQNFRATLDGYRGVVEAYIAANAAGKRADTVVPTASVVAHDPSENRRTSLPYVTAIDQVWSGQVPDVFRTTFTVSLNNQAYGTYFADVVGEQAMQFTYAYSGSAFAPTGPGNAPAIVSSVLDDCDQYLGAHPTAAAAVAQVAINHPYAANSGGYADRTISRQIQNKQCSFGTFTVTNDWGYTGTGTGSRMAPAASRIRSDPAYKNNLTFGPTLANIASQYSAFLDLAGRAQNNVYTVHDLIGIHTLDSVNTTLTWGGSTDFDPAAAMSMDFEASVSAFSKSGLTADDTTAAYTAGLGLGYAEGAVPRQETDAVYDMAALNLLTQQDARVGAAGTYATYLANPSSWANVRGQLASDYPGGAMSALDRYVQGEGYSVLVPQHGALRQPSITVPIPSSNLSRVSRLWEGTNADSYGAANGGELTRSAFLAFHPSAGSGSAPDRVALVMFDQRRGGIIKAGIGVALDSQFGSIRKPDAPKPESRDVVRTAASVDGKTGALSYAPPADLADGPGEFPRSLSLQRVYDQRDQTNYGLGVGWKTNWYQAATMNNDGMAALGRSGASGMASALVAIQALGDLVTTQDAQHLYAAAQVAAWLTDQTMNNSVVVAKGLDGEQTFYRQASGAYANGRPDGATLTVSGTPATGIINRRIYPNYTIAFADAAGTTRNYPQVGAPGSDLSSPYIASVLTPKTLYMNNWTFPNGVQITAGHGATLATHDVSLLTGVANNVGRAIGLASYDYGSLGEQPVCTSNGALVTYNPGRNAEVDYQTSTGTRVKYVMDAQVHFQVTGDPDTARCPANSMTPPETSQEYASGLQTFTDTQGGAWSYGYVQGIGAFGGANAISDVYKPTASSPAVHVTYGADGNVRSLTDLRSNSWQYRSSAYRSEVVSPLQAAGTGQGNATYYDQYGQAVRGVDPLGRTSSTGYDDLGRQTQVTRPENNATVTDYDARGNAVRTTMHAKPNSNLDGSTPADIVTTTGYVEGPTVTTCSNLVTCNRVAYTVDGQGHRTNYSWDPNTGELLGVTSGLASDGQTCLVAGGTCPQTTYGYTAFTGIPGAGYAATGTVVLPTSKTEQISAGASRMTSYDYNTSNKLTLKERVVDKGGLSLRSCYKFDSAGNLISTTESNAGLAVCQ